MNLKERCELKEKKSKRKEINLVKVLMAFKAEVNFVLEEQWFDPPSTLR